MQHRFIHGAALTLAAASVAGCTRGDDPPVSRGADGDCIRAWNAEGNTDNRAVAAREWQGWALEVSESRTLRPAEGLTMRGCAYFFYSASRWTSVRGMWETDGDLRWGVPPTARGSMAGAQGTRPPNAVLRPDGSIARR